MLPVQKLCFVCTCLMIEWIIICDSLYPFTVELKGLAYTKYLALSNGEVANGISQNYAYTHHLLADISASAESLLRSKENTVIDIRLLMTSYDFKTWTEQEGELLPWAKPFSSCPRKVLFHSVTEWHSSAVPQCHWADAGLSTAQVLSQVMQFKGLWPHEKGNRRDFRPRQKSRLWLTMPFLEALNWVSWDVH